MNTLTQLVAFLARLFNLLILVRVLLTWIPMVRTNALITFIFAVTEPILAPIRRILPPMGGLDLSPVVAMVLLQVISTMFRGLVA